MAELWLVLLLAAWVPFSVYGQQPGQAGQKAQPSLAITVNRITPTFDAEKKFTGIGSETVIETITVPADEGTTQGDVLARTFEHHFDKNEYLRLKIANNTPDGWYVSVVNRGEDNSCAEPADAGDGSSTVRISPGTTADLAVMLSGGGIERFVMLASTKSGRISRILTTFDLLLGNIRGNATEQDLKEIDAGGPIVGIAKGKEIGDAGKIMITLGSVYSREGQTLKKADFYDALLLTAECHVADSAQKRLAFKELAIGWLNNKALANYQTGNLGQSKADYEDALVRLRGLQTYEKPRFSEEATIRTNLAEVYSTLGDQPKAIEIYQQALDLLQKERVETAAVLRIRIAAIYGGLGASYESLLDYDKAAEYYQKGLVIEREQRQRASEGITLNCLARISMKRGDQANAELLFNQALQIATETGTDSAAASANNNLAVLYLRQQKFDFARQCLLRALELLIRIDNRTAQATILGNLMLVEQRTGHPETAILYGKRAVRVLQLVRREISGLDKDLQRSFALSREDTYRDLADLMISEGRLYEAQSVLDLLKDQEYKALARSGETPDTVPYSKLEQKASDAVDHLTELRLQLGVMKARQKEQGAAFPADSQKVLDQVTADITTANANFDAALVGLAGTEQSVDKRVDEIRNERSLQSVLQNLSRQQNTGVAALYTVIGTEPAKDATGAAVKDKVKTKFGWVILVTSQDRKAYPIDVKDLEKNVFDLRAALSGDGYDVRPLAQKIYNAIFRTTSGKQTVTLESDLAKLLGKYPDKTLMWSLDGVLRYVPMAALHDGKDYLVEKYRNIVFTREGLPWLMTPPSPGARMLGLGVSAGNADLRMEALPGVEKELADVIREGTEKTGLINGTRKLNADFKKQDILDLKDDDNKFQRVHIASHYAFDPADDAASFLLVGDGKLTFGEMSRENNLFGTVDLLTLSACDTAMSANGKESEGFAYLAQSLGAKSVIASLWKVSDDGTPELMKRFYKLLADNPSMSKGEAFQQAQISLLTGKDISGKGGKAPKRDANRVGGTAILALPPFVEDPKKPYAHPHYWAPFVLIGNWQ